MKQPITLGVLAQFLGGFYFGTILQGITRLALEQSARVLAVQTMHTWTSQPNTADSQPFALPVAWEQVDGWIILVSSVDDRYLHRLKALGKPLVSVGAQYPELAVPTVLADNRQGSADAVAHLLAHGHTRIGFVGYLDSFDAQERYAGYCAALTAHGHTPDPAFLFAVDDNIKTGGLQAAHQLQAAGLPCTAVVAATDLNAIGVLEGLEAAGYHIPEDLALTGFDNIDLAQVTIPPLTSINQPLSQLGRTAAQLVLQQLEGVAVAPVVHRLPTALIPRGSCGCTPATLSADPASTAESGLMSWPLALAADLERMLKPSLLSRSLTSLADAWPQLETLLGGLAAVLDEQTPRSFAELEEAWLEVSALTLDTQVLDGILSLLEMAGTDELQRRNDLARLPALQQFLRQARFALLRATQRFTERRSHDLEQTIQSIYDLSIDLLGMIQASPQQLRWLQQTPAMWGCLGLWHPRTSGVLALAGSYSVTQQALPALGSTLRVEQFPPLPAHDADAALDGSHIFALLPIKTEHQDWGILTVQVGLETRHFSTRDRLRQWAALLGVALDHEASLRTLQAQQEQLQAAYNESQSLVATIQELSSPVIPLLDGVLLVPLIGSMSYQRAQQFIEAVLTGVSVHQAEIVLVDITGISMIDTAVAHTLIQATKATTLLGARVILVGMRPEIAQSIVGLGLDLLHIDTQPSLAVALEHVRTLRGLH